MRTYLFSYYAEHRDECWDYQHEIKAENIVDALLVFTQSPIVYKRIFKIEELPFKK